MPQNDIRQTFKSNQFRVEEEDRNDLMTVEFRDADPTDLTSNPMRVWANKVSGDLKYTVDGVTVQGVGTAAQIDEINAQLADIAISVKNYGAVGDGVTDDTSAISDAITALSANGGGKLFFPPGDYRVTLSSDGALSFDNMNDFEVVGVGAKIYCDPLLVTNASPNTRLIRFTNCSRFKVSGLHFLYQVDWDSAPTSLTRDEQLLQVFADTGEVCEDFEITRNTFEYSGPSLNDPASGITNRYSTVALASQTALGDYEPHVKQFVISNNTFLNCVGRTIYCLTSSNGSIVGNVMRELGTYVKPDLSEKNYAEAVGVRILASRDISVVGNTINCYSGELLNVVDHGSIHTFVTGNGGFPGQGSINVTFVGNTVNCFQSGTWVFGIGECTNVTFSGNTATADDSTAITYGVRCEQVPVDNASIRSNTFNNMSAFYFLDNGVDGDYTNVVIEGNTHKTGNNTSTTYSTNTKARSVIGLNYWSDKAANCRGPERQRVITANQLPPLAGTYTAGDICLNTGFDRSVCPVSEWVFELNSAGVNYWRPSVFAISTIQPALPVTTDDEKLQFRGLQYLDTSIAEAQLAIWGGFNWLRADGTRLTNPKKGTTAQRPVFTSGETIGFVYLDTTLNANGKPIWWTGTAWVDSTGASV